MVTKFLRSARFALVSSFCCLLLQACGGGGANSELQAAAIQVPVQVAPAPPTSPPPPPPPPPIKISISGEEPVADNFDTAAGTEVYDPTGARGRLPDASGETVGAFRMRCNAGHLNYDDPLVYPGQPGAAHLHQYWGNTAVDAYSTSRSIREKGGTTCGDTNAPVNRTAYWMPAMLDGVGNVVKPDYINTYYKQVPAARCFPYAPKGCVGLPNGIRLVFGYNKSTGKDGPTDPTGAGYWTFRYECWADDRGTAAVSPPPGGKFRTLKQVADARCPVGSILVVYFTVPGCWNGEVDSPDHRTHLTFGTQEGCPPTHPYLITPWQGQVKYTVDQNFATWRLSSDEVGMEAGSTLHFDYWEGWSPPIKERWQKNCIDAFKSCSSGDLGDGFWIKQTPVTPTGQRVPVPPRPSPRQ